MNRDNEDYESRREAQDDFWNTFLITLAVILAVCAVCGGFVFGFGGTGAP